MDRARKYLDASFARKVALLDLAAVADRSRYGLLRSFRQVVGLTPALTLPSASSIRNGNLRRCSSRRFAGPSHLSRHFKRLTGNIPSGYALEVA